MKRETLGTLRARIAALEGERVESARNWLHTDAARLMLIDDRDEWQRRAEINGERADNACHELARWVGRTEVAEAALRTCEGEISANVLEWFAAETEYMYAAGDAASINRIVHAALQKVRVVVEGQEPKP